MRIPVLLSPFVLLVGCVAPSSPPPQAQAPVRPVPMRPAPVMPPAPAGDWRDLPLTPGTWQYRGTPGGSAASFGARDAAPVATLTCERAGGRVTLTMVSPRPQAGSVSVRTSSTVRAVAVQPVAGGVAMRLPANDRLLDAMGFSRGRFVVEGPAVGRLVLPAWAEILRVTEDCRG